jgi:hypothetical protein
MKLLLLVLALPNFLWGQWNVAIEGGANYIPITFSEFRTFTGNPSINSPINYTLGVGVNYKYRTHKFTSNLTMATANFEVNNLKIISETPNSSGFYETQGMLYKSKFRSKCIQLNFGYSKLIIQTPKASLWSGIGVLLNIPWNVGLNYYSKCGYPKNGMAKNGNRNESLKYSGIVNLQHCITWNSLLEKPIAKTPWSYIVSSNILYYYPYTEFGNLESRSSRRRGLGQECNLVRLETYNTFGFQVKVGLSMKLQKTEK